MWVPQAKKIPMRIVVSVCLLILLSGQASAGERVVPAERLEGLADAKQIYQENCAVCHGYDGVPLVAGAANFSIGERLEKTDAALLEIIARGKDDMPPWEDILSEQERREALSYIRVLAGDQVFGERCVSCHGPSVPLVPDLVPRDVALSAFAGPLDICLGSSVEADMSRKELVDVINFIRAISE